MQTCVTLGTLGAPYWIFGLTGRQLEKRFKESTLNFVIKETIVIKETPCGACKVKFTCPMGHVQFGAKCPYGRVKAQVYMPRRTCSFSLRARAGA